VEKDEGTTFEESGIDHLFVAGSSRNLYRLAKRSSPIRYPAIRPWQAGTPSKKILYPGA
jgi:hypothetical protein